MEFRLGHKISGQTKRTIENTFLKKLKIECKTQRDSLFKLTDSLELKG